MTDSTDSAFDLPSDDITSQGGEGRRCEGLKDGGERCPAPSLGDGWTIPNFCYGHARGEAKRAGIELVRVDAEPLEQGARAAARVDVRQTVADALVEIPAEDLKAYIRKAVLEGRDVRAITTLLDRVYGDEAAHVEEPHTFDQLARLSREQRRTLLTQLEREGRSDPLG